METAEIKRLGCIMLVDDDDSTNYLHKIIIEEMQITEQIFIARNGQEALDTISNHLKEDKCPDLIFLDINMPVMDGFEFLQEYNELNFTEASPIVIMVTSSSYPADIERAHQLSVSEYISKPLNEEIITALLKKHFT